MLKSHYLIEDFPALMNQLQATMKEHTKAWYMIENGDFSQKDKVVADFKRALDIAEALNRKKINSDVHREAWAHLKGHVTYDQ